MYPYVGCMYCCKIQRYRRVIQVLQPLLYIYRGTGTRDGGHAILLADTPIMIGVSANSQRAPTSFMQRVLQKELQNS